MKLFESRQRQSVFVFVCAGILFIQLILIAFCNITLGPKNIDCDSAKLYVHAIEMAKNHSFFVDNWDYITTMELDCSLLLAVPLFMLTQNIYISFGIANLFLVALLIGTLFVLFSNKNKLYPLLCANFILIPYGIGQLDYFNMMFFNGSQYIVKLLLPMMLIALLTLAETKEKFSLGRIFFGIIYSLLLFICCLSSGVYILAVGIFPVFAGALFYQLYNRKKLYPTFMVLGIWSAFVAVAGLFGNIKLAADSKGNSMALCSVMGELKDNISACFLGMFELFGGAAYDNVPVMSFDGIKILLHMGFVMLILLGGYFLFRQVLQRKEQMLSCLLVFVFVWNTFILCVCKTRYGAPTFEYRYHIIGMIPLLCGAVITVLGWYEKETKKWKVGIASTLILMLLALNITSYKNVFSHENDVSNYQQVCDYITDEGVETVYFLYDSISAEMCRLLDYENAVYVTVNDAGNTVVYDYYKKYSGAPITFDDAVLAVSNSIYDYGDSMEMFGHVYTRVQIVGNYSIYI